jgi:hypothetical protein
MCILIRRAMRLAGVFLIAVFSTFSFATYSVNSIDYPCAVSSPGNSTSVWGNNNNGMVVGNASCDGGVTSFIFTYDPNSGAYIHIDNPPGFDGITSSVGAVGINDAGEITGGTFEPTVSRGFIWSGGTYTFFFPTGSPSTTGRSISNASAAFPQGLVVGFSFSADLTTADGIIYNPATLAYTALGLPSPSPTIAQGMNVAGQIVGNVKDGTYSGAPPGPRAWAFLFTPTTYGDPTQGGTVSYFQINGLDTRARGINDNGVIATFANFPGGVLRTYAATSAGFEEIVVPNASYAGSCANSTVGIQGAGPEGLNNAGQVSGLFSDTNCVEHGYIASPASTPVGTTASGAYIFNVDVVPNTPIFIDPALALGYDYAIGKHDPAFATVRLPLGIGNNKFVLVVDEKAYDLNAGQLFDFTALGHGKRMGMGVETFRVTCIDPAAMLDPVNSLAFPTELTFTGAGTFTGTQQPLTDPTGKGNGGQSGEGVHGNDSGKTITQAECRKRLLGNGGRGDN